MKLKYTKTPDDINREKSDIARSPIMRFLKNQEHFKFNIGDIVVKQRKIFGTNEWHTELIPGVKSPKKFMYVFENELGIGYMKQLRVDGTGFTSTLVCTANFDPDSVRFVLDPEFVDHVLLGDEDFEHNKEYKNKKAFRDEAIKKNKKILVNTRKLKTRMDWISNLKIGDVFWVGDKFDDMVHNNFKVVETVTNERPLTIMVVSLVTGYTRTFDEDFFVWRRVTMQPPFPMEDPLCDHPR